MQVDDGLTHMLEEVFDERLENMSESSARIPETNNWQTKDTNKHRKHGKEEEVRTGGWLFGKFKNVML